MHSNTKMVGEDTSSESLSISGCLVDEVLAVTQTLLVGTEQKHSGSPIRQKCDASIEALDAVMAMYVDPKHLGGCPWDFSLKAEYRTLIQDSVDTGFCFFSTTIPTVIYRDNYRIIFIITERRLHGG